MPVVAFKEKFSTSAATNFGCGWTWLVKNSDGSLEIVNTTGAGNPMRDGKTPLLTIDVWEHAYYIDKRNARPAYVADFWNIRNEKDRKNGPVSHRRSRIILSPTGS